MHQASVGVVNLRLCSSLSEVVAGTANNTTQTWSVCYTHQHSGVFIGL